jgi:NTP pyrophosphatase (non-canonical NTP hydrolase)
LEVKVDIAEFNPTDYLEEDLINYQNWVEDIRSEHHSLEWAVLGLAAEAGEVSGVLEKAIRKKGAVDEEDRDKIFDELGDVLWYLTATASELDVTLEEVIEHNMHKLNTRLDEGTLYGR